MRNGPPAPITENPSSARLRWIGVAMAEPWESFVTGAPPLTSRSKELGVTCEFRPQAFTGKVANFDFPITVIPHSPRIA